MVIMYTFVRLQLYFKCAVIVILFKFGSFFLVGFKVTVQGECERGQNTQTTVLYKIDMDLHICSRPLTC